MNWKNIAVLVVVGGGLLAGTLWYTRHQAAAAKAAQTAAKTGTGTNALAGATRPGIKIEPKKGPAGTPGAPATTLRPPGALSPLPPGARMPGLTNATAKTTPSTNAPAAKPAGSGLLDKVKAFPSSKLFYPSVGALFIILLGLALFFQSRGSKTGKKTLTTSAAPSSKLAVKPRKVGTIHCCNVLEIGNEARQVWQFDARGGRYVLNREQTCLDGDALPLRMVAKDWRSLFQHKLNIAWLPPENVFLRVAQFPKSDFEETLAMVELQLEKLSPIPVAQIVWSIQILTHAEGNLQTVIVMIVSRNVVEEFLGKLEGQGFLADRLELPLLDQLQTTAITRDGAWIYPAASGGKNSALVAWWYGGVLQNLDLLTMPAEGATRSAALKEQLMQMAWAGEMEGWLTAPPEWHLVADVAAADWEPALRAGLEQPVEIVTPLPPSQMAALTARRAAQGDPRASLMPLEFATKYQQQFFDRLWMRGLLALVGIYALGVAIYLVALTVKDYQATGVETDVATLAPAYTNALQMKARYELLKERQELKFAALDCYNATARQLPGDATLENLNFNEGKRLDLAGSAPANAFNEINDFTVSLQRSPTKDGQALFNASKSDSPQWHVVGPSATWTLKLELKRSETQ